MERYYEWILDRWLFGRPRYEIFSLCFNMANVAILAGGPKAAFGGAVGCAILLGVFEGIGVLMGRMFAQPIPQLPRTSAQASCRCECSFPLLAFSSLVPEAAPPAVTA